MNEEMGNPLHQEIYWDQVTVAEYTFIVDMSTRSIRVYKDKPMGQMPAEIDIPNSLLHQADKFWEEHNQ
jgi:hypothetical protein